MKGTHGKPNEQLFPRQVVIQLSKYVTHIIGEPKYKYGQQEQVTVMPPSHSDKDHGLHCVLKNSMNAVGTWSKRTKCSFQVHSTSLPGSHYV